MYVSNKDVQDEVHDELQNFVKEKEITKRGAKTGDILYIQYTGYVKGRPYKELQNIETDFELGSNTFLEGFEKNFIGVYPFTKISFEMLFPEDYFDIQLRNQKVFFEVSIYKIIELVIPKLTDSFVNKNFDCNNVQEYIDIVTDKVYTLKYNMLLDDLKNTLLSQIVESTSFNMSYYRPVIAKRIHEVLQSYNEYAKLSECSVDDVYQWFDTSEDILIETATYNQKKYEVCKKIIKEKKLLPAANEYESLCYDFAQQCGYDSIEQFTKDNGTDYLQEKVYEKIVKDYLFAIALQIDK